MAVLQLESNNWLIRYDNSSAWKHMQILTVSPTRSCRREEVVLAQVHSNSYRAFDSINHPPLAILGVEVDWNASQMLKVSGTCCTPISFIFQRQLLVKGRDLPVHCGIGHVISATYRHPASHCSASIFHAECQQHTGEWSIQAALQA